MKFRASFIGIPLLSLAFSAWAEPPACALKAEELSKTFGVQFTEGKIGLEIPAGGMVMRDCRYGSKNYTVMLKTSVFKNPADAQGATKMLAGKLQQVTGDPDGAVIQEGQGDATSPAIHYTRNGVAVELRILGIYYKDAKPKETELREMRTKLLGLRRVP